LEPILTDSPRGLAEYLEAVASGAPAPGGGSVAAIVGALAAALGEMVTNLSTGRGLDSEIETQLTQAQARLTDLRGGLFSAAEADERAYGIYRLAAAMPRADAGEKAARREAMQEALVGATEVPLGVARASAATAEAMEAVARLGNPHLRSDAALGALLAESALRGALLNVRGNAAMLRDAERAEAYLAEADRLEVTGRDAAGRAWKSATEPEVNPGPR
jgi:formiminotetrahydrofolate cyclodeaminase